MAESDFEDLVRRLVALMVNQDAINDRLTVSIERLSLSIDRINIAIEGIDTTLARVETLLARLIPPSDNGTEA